MVSPIQSHNQLLPSSAASTATNRTSRTSNRITSVVNNANKRLNSITNQQDVNTSSSSPLARPLSSSTNSKTPRSTPTTNITYLQPDRSRRSLPFPLVPNQANNPPYSSQDHPPTNKPTRSQTIKSTIIKTPSPHQPHGRISSQAYSSSPLSRSSLSNSNSPITPSTHTQEPSHSNNLRRSTHNTSLPLTQSSLGHHSKLLNESSNPTSYTAHQQPEDQLFADDNELITEIPDHAELDEDMQAAIQSVIQAHSSQLVNLRRVLSSADHGSSMSMHLLHAEIKLLQDKISTDQEEIETLKKRCNSLTLQLSRSTTHLAPASTRSLVQILSSSNDEDLQKYFRTLPPPSRLHLLHLLLEAAVPGDIASLKKYLENIERSKRDFIALLPPDLSIRCLLYLDLPSILRCRSVSRRWNDLITFSGLKLWRALSLALTSQDDEPPKPKENSAEGWFELYKGLHYREENWRKGLAQRVVVLKGHTGSIGAIKLRGITLVTGSLDGTLRIWNVRTSNCLKIVKMPAPVSSLDFYGQYGPTGVIAAGGNDVGRIFLISMNGSLLSTLSGHNKGIRTLAMNNQYLVSGGYDKALVVWNWKQGTRIVKFGQQTNPCAAISLFGSTFSSVQVDGVIRCFNILTRELVSQHKVQTHERGAEKLGLAADMFQWFVAEERRVIIATKTKIYQLEYNLGGPDGITVDLSSPPRLISLTPIKHELNSGTLDVLKRRFAAAPRFATRLGDDMRIFIGHLPEYPDQVYEEDEQDEDNLQPIGGAWLNAESSVSSRNPTCMSLSSDQLVVGCSDGLLYGLDFCGTGYRSSHTKKEIMTI